MVTGTSLAAMALWGTLAAVPTAAQVLSAEPAATSVSTESAPLRTTDPEPGKEKEKDKDRPGPGDGCFEIDTVRQEAAGGGAFYAATSGGVAYVGDELSPLGPIDWDDLSDEGGDVPVGACGVSIDVGPTGQGSDIVIDVITTAGTVHTITCDRTGSVITECGTWVERDAPTPGATTTP
ncbi:hypothetical protein [Streptomyces viridosporus]|uniref:hypothetical protein n=1 Tax=Streptomyces viridosporus TaxID=67581 RepID=UPI00118057FB|nr:hypothetical protein [Streptomyces viridosporus]